MHKSIIILYKCNVTPWQLYYDNFTTFILDILIK
jgi:hypothetical protein